MKKLDKEIVKKEFESNGWIVHSEYINYGTPLELSSDGYKFRMSYLNFKQGNKPILFGKKCKYYKENIILFITRLDKDIQVLKIEYKKNGGKIRPIVFMKCKCGKEFSKNWENIYSGKQFMGCPKCVKHNQTSTTRDKHTKKYLKNFENSGYVLFDAKQKLYANQLTKVIQKSTGYIGYVYPNRMKCLKKMILFSIHTNSDNLIFNLNRYAELNGYKTRILEKIGKDDGRVQNVLCLCECGNKYNTTHLSFLNSKWRCDECSRKVSSYEQKIKNYLTELNIEFLQEYKINSCKDVLPLRFDFYLTQYNFLIEIDGEQHFRPVGFGRKETKEELEVRFKAIQHRDKIKNDFCKENNIPLLRISYVDFIKDNYKSILNNFIQTIQE